MGGHHGGTKFANCVSGGGDSGSGVMEWVEALGAEDSGSECLFRLVRPKHGMKTATRTPKFLTSIFSCA